VTKAMFSVQGACLRILWSSILARNQTTIALQLHHHATSAVMMINPLMDTVKTEQRTIIQEYGDWYTDGWTVTFGTSRCTKCNSPPINGKCNNYL